MLEQERPKEQKKFPPLCLLALTHTLVLSVFLCLSLSLFLSLSVYYASGCSIARFPEGGTVIASTLKDQGKHHPLPNSHLSSVSMEMDHFPSIPSLCFFSMFFLLNSSSPFVLVFHSLDGVLAHLYHPLNENIQIKGRWKYECASFSFIHA